MMKKNVLNHHGRSSRNTTLNMSTAEGPRQKPEWYKHIHRNSWLCSLVSPRLFFISLYLSTIGFWLIIGMGCGGGVSSHCPLPVLQSFSMFQNDGGNQLRKCMDSNVWHTYKCTYKPPTSIILIFSWFEIIASAMGLYAFRQAYNFACRRIEDRNVSLHPLYLLAPSLFGYFCTFLLLFCWTYFVVEAQVPDFANNGIDMSRISTFVFLTLLPLITIWSGFFYVIYGLMRTVCFMRVLLNGWPNRTPPSNDSLNIYRRSSINSGTSRTINSVEANQPSNARRSFRHVVTDGLNQMLKKKERETSVMEPLNHHEITVGSIHSQRLDSILEVPER